MLVHRWSGKLELVLRLISYDWMMPLTLVGGFHVSRTSTVWVDADCDRDTSACRSVGAPGTIAQHNKLNTTSHDNVYDAIIMAVPLWEVTQFIWQM